jgi:hypothetical protein
MSSLALENEVWWMRLIGVLSAPGRVRMLFPSEGLRALL